LGNKPLSLEHVQKFIPQIQARARLTQAIREFFCARDFLEVETPSLVFFPESEPLIEPFQTRFKPEDPAKKAQDLYLISSPELAMKRMVCAGLPRIFQISRVWRNGEEEGWHNPEFSLLEWYRAYADRQAIQKDIEHLLPELAALFEKFPKPIDFTPPYEEIPLKEAFRRWAHVDLEDAQDFETLKQSAIGAGMEIDPRISSWRELFGRIFVERVEPRLPRERPFFLVQYPAQEASLAKLSEDSPLWSERFELYVGGLEIANGFSELNNPGEQMERFKKNSAREMDPDFVAALTYGMPPSAGVALGVDRLLMALTGVQEIAQVLAFPFSHRR
jgi:lysyl-tRNA synthetase class 2